MSGFSGNAPWILRFWPVIPGLRDASASKNRQMSKECHIIVCGHWPSSAATLNFRNYEMEKNENFVEGDMDLIWCNHSRVG